MPQEENNLQANPAVQDETTQTSTAPARKEKPFDVRMDREKKVFPLVIGGLGIVLMLAQWIGGLNLIALIGVVYLIATAVMLSVGLFAKKRIYVWMLVGYLAVSFGICTFYIFNGADAGWGAIHSGSEGFQSSDNLLWTGEGNFGTRLLGNVLIFAPSFLAILGVCFFVMRSKSSTLIRTTAVRTLSVLLVITSVLLVFTMNLRSNPKVFDMTAGHDDYLSRISQNANKKNNPNVLVILMDDMGYGDTSYNARKAGRTPSFETPNIDSIAQNGVDMENFYANYSVCSPSRFAMMTGRYPYRGYADNVMYPTVNTILPLNTTRVFNAIEMGNNCDGMLGDEVTMAEALHSAGYATGAFGKWHLGDYGQYLPTNQGFDYFYGSHHINDNTPYYHVEEVGGQYVMRTGADMDQSSNTKLIHEKMIAWLDKQAASDQPFFAYYATPWPHAPVHAGYEFQGKSGAGIYGDCLMEFDYYLGLLFSEMQSLGVLDDTIILFTSDNGPALQGSTNELRGGKYTAYEAGQKVPCYVRWDNAEQYGYSGFASDTPGQARTIEGAASIADIYPSLARWCGVTDSQTNKVGFLPSDVDREIDGVDMTPLFADATGKQAIIHDMAHPILHMKREKIVALQYAMTREQVLESVAGYTYGEDHDHQTADEAAYAQMPFIRDNDVLRWKYFRKVGNDNPAFFDKNRKNWLICLTDDSSESYQRADLFPTIAQQMDEQITVWTKKFHANRRGYYADYYKR